MSWLKVGGAILVVLAILAAFYNFSLNQIDPSVYFDPTEAAGAVHEVPIGRIVATALAMLIGIAFGAVYDAVKGRDKIDSYRSELVELAHSTRLIKGLLAAPIVFV